jgi:hypothetical protein
MYGRAVLTHTTGGAYTTGVPSCLFLPSAFRMVKL